MIVYNVTAHLLTASFASQRPSASSSAMKLILVLFALVASALAVPQSPKDAQITAYSNDVGLDGYNFQFQTSDGISRNEQGVLKNPGTENEALEVKGTYTYKGPDGKDITVTFVANENGYQPIVSARRK